MQLPIWSLDPMECPPLVLQGSLILKILKGKYPPVTGYSKELLDIVKSCLTLVSNTEATVTAAMRTLCIGSG
jgi:hypothetical protein